jgi:hypothetical protein
MTNIEDFVDKGVELIEKWKVLKNNIVSKTKIINENKTSIETLERNIGIDNEFIQNLKNSLASSTNIEEELRDFSVVECKLNDLRKTCIQSISILLELHNRLCKETILQEPKKKNLNTIKSSTLSGYESDYEISEVDINDPVGVEAAKLLWGKIDNLQLRSDPPISGIYKDDMRKSLVDTDNDVNVSGSNLDIYFNEK